ncbi:MAG: hypothetical protein IMY67_10675 [Bacteroidetes bacterium]|nr:hypothetical protein [Bacteroidota bacterium]
MRSIDREPHAFELWILKWIFLPIIVCMLLIAFISNSVDRNKCFDVCETKGFADALYVPNNRAGVGKKCICRESKNGSKDIEVQVNW